MAKAPCMEEGCERKKYSTYHRCSFHWLLTQPIEEQVQWAERRLKNSRSKQLFGMRHRVPEDQWPAGERWCSGCQSFIPLFYARKARCIACASKANHDSHVQRTYQLDPQVYAALLEWQRGRCFICGRVPRSRRLAVDHDHSCCPGSVSCGRCVRGLLCADDERGCNHAVLGNLEASARTTALDAARRLVAYLEASPIERMRRGDPAPGISNDPSTARGIMASLQPARRAG